MVVIDGHQFLNGYTHPDGFLLFEELFDCVELLLGNRRKDSGDLFRISSVVGIRVAGQYLLNGVIIC